MAKDFPEITGSPLPRDDSLTPSSRGADWLRAALNRARDRAVEPSGELAASVRVYIQHLRDEGVPPERALVLLKGMIEQTFDELGATSPHRQLADRIVAEAIAAYYTER